jgi:(2R)-3-sulfolactate dehydrogenase (NADP+)
MSEPVRLSLGEAEDLATAALVASRTSPENARATARALVAAEADGQAGHGLARVPSYAIQSRAGKVHGFAVPAVEKVAGAALRVDGGHGFAYPAIDLAIDALVPLARDNAIAVAAIHRSHHFGQAGAHAERLAMHGLIGLVLANSPKAMAFWGGRKAMLGTNPLAFGAPLPGDAPPLVIDLAMSVAARGRIVAADKAGKPIPSDWAVDAAGQPTSDPKAALAGTLLPIGGAKGGALALMIEILAAAVTGSAYGWEASSFFDDHGGPPNMGHVFIAIDPARLSAGAYEARMATILAAIADEPGARLPGTRRLANRVQAATTGMAVPAALHTEIRALIERPA